MNTQEKLIAGLLGLLLVGWLFFSQQQAAKQAAAVSERAKKTEATASGTNVASSIGAPASAPAAAPAPVASDGVQPVVEKPAMPEEVAVLEDGEMQVKVSSHGAVLTHATLSQFAAHPGPKSASNPAVAFDFADAPALALNGLPGLAANAAYAMEREAGKQAVTLTVATQKGLTVVRRIELLKDYQIKISDTIKNVSSEVVTLADNSMNIGVLAMGASANDMLSLDSLPVTPEAKTVYWASEKQTKAYLVGGTPGGCGGSTSAAGMPEKISVPITAAQKWVALKSRFFVAALASDVPNTGFVMTAVRDPQKQVYALKSVSAHLQYAGQVLAQGQAVTRTYTMYLGPKKLSLLRSMGNKMDDVMEFGFFSWFCKLLLPTLNFFYSLIPNYGVAILLLTVLVRIIFWPLTHSSTKSMKKMQEIQPKLKEIQALYKDNPQKMQQETWAVYRDNKVNPLSSCLPMLVQIPVFIALFTVLRSAVELRYASFLWIADLSEPENLFMGMIPFVGALNILPILMAATMAIQTYLTPSAGDPQQQKMMMIMMPIMMLFMFYSFPSALSLYWTVSQVLSIVQMLMMRRNVNHPHKPDVEVIQTRQQRRADARG
jgi:YidC/Oxa1 family membrane protein insertase